MSQIKEYMCEKCAGGGSYWKRIPSTSPYELLRHVADSGSGQGFYTHCHDCKGKGFIPITKTK